MSASHTHQSIEKGFDIATPSAFHIIHMMMFVCVSECCVNTSSYYIRLTDIAVTASLCSDPTGYIIIHPIGSLSTIFTYIFFSLRL